MIQAIFHDGGIITHAYVPRLRRSGFTQAGETRHLGVQARTMKITEYYPPP
jgi:hypothetical protein